MDSLRRAFKTQNTSKDQSLPNTARPATNLDENWELIDHEPKSECAKSFACVSSKSSSMSVKEIR